MNLSPDDNKKTFIIRLGGSVISKESGKINNYYLSGLKQLLEEYAKNGFRFAVICGGGSLFRSYAQSIKDITNNKVDDNSLDWVGIYTNNLHAVLLKTIFDKELVYPEIITDLKKIKEVRSPIVVIGAEEPGHSSNYDAVEITRNLGGKKIINLSNTSYIYDKDPAKYKDAIPFSSISWSEYLKLIPEKWTPALSTPFDPVSSRHAMSLGLEIVFMKGEDILDLKNYLNDNFVLGTIIS